MLLRPNAPVDWRPYSRRALLALGLALLLQPLAGSLSQKAAGPLTPSLPTLRPRPLLPISFEPNAGQTAPGVRFTAHGMGGTLFFSPSEVVLALPAPGTPNAKLPAGETPSGKNKPGSAPVPLRLQFIGTNPSAA